jgi:hypothetical protein
LVVDAHVRSFGDPVGAIIIRPMSTEASDVREVR